MASCTPYFLEDHFTLFKNDFQIIFTIIFTEYTLQNSRFPIPEIKKKMYFRKDISGFFAFWIFYYGNTLCLWNSYPKNIFGLWNSYSRITQNYLR